MQNIFDQSNKIMAINMPNNWNCRYFGHYIIKFIGFMPIYYTINFDIVLSFMVFSILYFGSIDLL